MQICTRRAMMASLASAASLSRTFGATLQQVKLGVTTDEIDEDLKTALQFLRTHGLAWAEIRNLWGKYNTVQPVDKIKEARSLLDEYQIRCSVLGTGFFKIPLPAAGAEGKKALDDQWKLLDGAMERASILGTDKIRIFAFLTGPQPWSEVGSRIQDLVSEAAQRANQYRLVVENVGGSYVSTGADSAKLLAGVHEKNLGLTWDPNNAGAVGEKAFPDGYKKLDPKKIWHVHLRDYRKGADGKYEWAPVGGGEMDNVGQIRALLRDGYKESFTLETHWKSPQGKAYATETSLKALKKVIAEV